MLLKQRNKVVQVNFLMTSNSWTFRFTVLSSRVLIELARSIIKSQDVARIFCPSWVTSTTRFSRCVRHNRPIGFWSFWIFDLSVRSLFHLFYYQPDTIPYSQKVDEVTVLLRKWNHCKSIWFSSLAFLGCGAQLLHRRQIADLPAHLGWFCLMSTTHSIEKQTPTSKHK